MTSMVGGQQRKNRWQVVPNHRLWHGARYGLILAVLGCHLTACQRTESPSNRSTPDSKNTASQTASTAPSLNSNSASQSASTSHVASASHELASTAQASDSVLDKPSQITLYTSIDKSALAPLITAYQKASGIGINVVNDEPMSIMARLKAEGDNSSADVILTEDVGVFHQGVEAGLLQPFSADNVVATIPERYRDPEGNWLALSYYARTAVYDSRVMTEKDISSYANFAQPKWFQKLCLSQASFIPNQSLSVNLLNNLGDKKAQTTLTGWVANLAMPPVLDDSALMQAIDNGKCQVGLVNSHSYANYLQKHPQSPIKLAWVNKGYGGVHTNVTAVAIPKTAKTPQFSLAFIEWLADKNQQTLFASLSNTFPLHKNAQTAVPLKAWGEFEASPIAVKEYAIKQKAVIEMIKDAGWQ